MPALRISRSSTVATAHAEKAMDKRPEPFAFLLQNR